MEEDTEYLKLPIEDQCVHKSWKARENGYKECAKLFATITEEKSPEFTKYAPLIKKFVTDSNVAAQEKALDAVLTFVENAHIAGKTTPDAIAGIVAKCFTSPKRTTQEKCLEVILMYCEIEKHEIVVEELIKGLGQKNPKVVCGCVKSLTAVLREFGSKVITIKPLVKCIVRLLEDKDKNIREEGKKMVIEMYRWVGNAILPQLNGLKPIQVQELEAEFDKLPKEKPSPNRYLRSQQEQKAKVQVQDVPDGDEGSEEEEEVVDPLDLMSPVNILDQLPKDFFDKVEAKKWQERKEAMDALLPLSQNPKLETGDYADVLKVLKKIIAKDTNVMIIALAGQCVCGIAKGLGKRFAPYAVSIMETIFEKFKEKKTNVVTALREAIDAVFLSTTIDSIQEIACAALNSKNPSVKSETASFLARAYCYCTPVALPKKLIKAYAVELLKTLNESDANVRDNSAQALGTLWKVVGEKNLAPFLSDVEALKMQKIKEFSEKAEIKVKYKPPKPKPVEEEPQESKPASKVIRGGRPTKPSGTRTPAKPKKPSPSYETSNGQDFEDDGKFSSQENLNKVPSSRPEAKSRIAAGRTTKPAARPGIGKTAVRPKIGGARPGAASRKEEAVDTSPLLQENSLKQQRTLDEHRMRTLRWEFSTPRPEFVLQLQDQMTKACLNQTLYNNMFHKDFKFHLKAIDALAENLNDNPEACIANIDLILRWLTLRFFDTNPSVILRAMDYLSSVFDLLSNRDYSMSDYEAKAFLPFLVMKMGDPKDAIRGPTKTIVNLMCNIYPASKVLPFVLEGLTSKNARQRAECLETIGSLIEIFGLTVCHPNPQATIKEVVKQVADRDNSVRNAALNCLLQVYFKQGEKIYKMLGNISEKDRTLLEERIKRASKNKPTPVKTEPEPPKQVIPKPEPGIRGAVGGARGINRVIPAPASMPAPPTRNRNQAPAAPSVDENENGICPPERKLNYRPLSADVGNMRSRIQIDYDYFEKLLSDESPSEEKYKVKIEEIPDLDTIANENVSCPPISSRLAKPGFLSCLSTNVNANAMNANMNNDDASQAINSVISQVTSTDVSTVLSALTQLNTVIEATEKRVFLTSHVDQFLVVIGFQYRHILNTKMSDSSVNKEECIRVYRSLTACLMNLMNVPELASKASTDVIRDVIQVCINIIMDSRLSELEDAPRLIRALNVLVVCVIQKANFTNIFSALLKLLNESVRNSGNVKYQELVMKCNWKAIQILPNKIKELNPVQLLQDANDFMKAYPSNTWADRPSTTPLQTIKTLLHQLNKVYKEDIFKYMAQVPNGLDSECHRYLVKDLNRSSEKVKENSPNINAGSNSVPKTTTPSKNLSKGLKDSLCEIFAIIGEKERTREGLRMLYDFKVSHPEADVNSVLHNSSEQFRNYIDRGLKRVEMERKAKNSSPASAKSESETISSAENQSAANEENQFGNLVDEFKEIASQAGFDNNYIDSAVNRLLSK